VTLHDLVEQARARLVRAGLTPEEARLDAEVLARHVLGWDRATWVARRRERAPDGVAARYEDILARRETREPVSHITGAREFWGLEFEVTPDVLTPRPETEFIVEEALAAWTGRPEPSIVIDVGTGSGCLAVALARAFASARVVAVDLSGAALAVARRNAARHGVLDRVHFVQGDLLAGVRIRADLIVSNPPYLPRVTTPPLAPEVRDHEPPVALFGGEDGLDPMRRLVTQAASRLRPDGLLIAEFGVDQETAVRQAFAPAAGWITVTVRRDLQGIPRVAVARRESAGRGARDAE
jgi:release factor glutamine methyltransferase